MLYANYCKFKHYMKLIIIYDISTFTLFFYLLELAKLKLIHINSTNYTFKSY